MKRQLLVNFTSKKEIELHEFLRKESFETGLPMAEILRQGLEMYKNKKEDGKMYKLDVFKVEFIEKDGYTVVDESQEWELVETIEAETEEECLEKAEENYDQENYHWTNCY